MTGIDSGSGPGYTSPEPIPRAVERAAMRSILLAHLVVGGFCRDCGQRPGPDGLCFLASTAFKWLTLDDRA